MRKQRLTHPQAIQGFTLVEVLVSIVIVAFGLLAMVAMQSTAIKFNKTSEYRSVATLLANDLGDRMKANRPGAIAGNYDRQNAYTQQEGVPGLNACNDPCSPATLAAQDLAQWQRSLYFSLPQSDAYVAYDATTESADVWIAWKDPGGNNDTDTTAVNEDAKECPNDFVSGDSPPRCMYFRIALPIQVSPPS